MIFARVHLVQCDPDYAATDNYLIDLLLDEKGIAKTNMAFFGLWGQIDKADNCYPFVLLKDGRIDLGAAIRVGDEDSPVRYQRTNLRERVIQVGELVTVWEADPDDPSVECEYTLRIHKITTADSGD